MNPRVMQLRTRYEGLLPRERLLLLGAVIAVVYLLWDFVAIQPFSDEVQRLQTQQENVQKEIQTLEAERTVLTNLASKDPLVALEQEVEALRRRLEQIDTELAELSVGLISADQLPVMLHDVLKSQKDLQLTQLRALSSERVSLAQEKAGVDDGESSEAANQDVKLYRHGVELEVRGQYGALTDYLLTLENNHWGFYWESLSYEVISHPRANATLRVFTLSGDRGLFDG